MLLEKFKRILRTDYEAQFQQLIDKLAYALNNTVEQIITTLTNNVSLKDNMFCTLKVMTVIVDSSGNPTTATQFPMVNITKAIGVICINAVNQTNSTSYGTTGITVNWSQAGTAIILNNITGLIPSNTYQMTFVAFG